MVPDIDEELYRRGLVTRPVAKPDGEWLTREEAVCWLMAWRDRYIPQFNLDFGPQIKKRITSGLENVYLNGLIDELIERVRNGTEDPVTEVAFYWYEMDEVLAMSDDDHTITHRFASYMENAAHEILNYLQKKEREMWNERKKLLRKPVDRS